MKVIEILRELESDPSLVSYSLEAITKRKDELEMLESVYKAKKTKLMTIIYMADLGATKLIKVAVALRNVMRDAQQVQAELKAIEYFKAGSDIDRIEKSLANKQAEWKELANQEYVKLFE